MRSTKAGNSNAAISGTGFDSEKRLIAVTRAAGVKGPSTATFIGTV
jgi:hypothetical protein